MLFHTRAVGLCVVKKNETINHAKEICKNQKSELFIHGEDGKIRERNSYGNDPFPPKG